MLRTGLLLRATLLCVAFSFWAILPAEAAAPPWRWSNPQPHGNNILDLAIRDDVVWQLGDRGQVYTSTPLDEWEPHDTGIPQALRGITFFGDQAFISAASGRILRGPSPHDLAVLNLRTPDWLESIAASNHRIVAVGDNGAIYSSSDGETWERQTGYSTWFRGIAYGNGSFVIVGEEGMILSSKTGIDWEQHSTSTANHLNRVKFINNRFWVVGDGGTVLTNDSQMRFLPVSPGITNDLFAVAGNSQEVIVAGDLAVYRHDLNSGTWSGQSHPTDADAAPAWPYYSALWDGRSFLLGGRTGMLVEGYRTSNTSPLLWTSKPQPSRNWLWSITRAPGLYAATGALGTVVTSEDGVEWNREVVPSSALDEVLLGIGGNSNVLVAVGTKGTILYSPNTITNIIRTNALGNLTTNTISLMGLVWNEADTVPTSHDLQGIAATDSLLVAVGGNGTVLTSADGVDWTLRPTPANTFLSSVTASPHGFFASGDLGTILASANGNSWKPRVSGVTNWIYSVRYLGGKLVAVGEAGLILTSDNGHDWQRQDSGTTLWLNDLTYDNGWYVAASNGYILTSPDAMNWSTLSTQTPRSLYGIASAGGQVVAVGLEGVILRRQLAPLTGNVDIIGYEHADQLNLFLFQGVPDQRFTLETAAEISGPWQPVAQLEILNHDGTLLFEHQGEEKSASFFRTTATVDQ